jgi:hypothetical protein
MGFGQWDQRIQTFPAYRAFAKSSMVVSCCLRNNQSARAEWALFDPPADLRDGPLRGSPIQDFCFAAASRELSAWSFVAPFLDPKILRESP